MLKKVPAILDKTKVEYLLLLGLTLRVLALLIVPPQHFSDANAYRISGITLFHGGSMNYRYMPLYPIISYLTGGGFFQKLFDCLLSTATIWLVFKLSIQLFKSKRAAILAAFFTAIYPYFIFYAISGLTETSYIFLLCLSFLCFYEKRYLWACVTAVLMILIRPTTALLNPFLIFATITLLHQENWKKGVKWVGIYCAIFVVLMSPWWLYNYQRFKTFVPLDLNSGSVLYSGNNPMNKSGGGIVGVDVNFKQFGPVHNPVARNKLLTKAAIHYISEHPIRTFKLDVVKFLRFWRLYPYAEQYKNPFTIIASLLSYGVMLLLALLYLGLFLKRDWKKLSPILLFILYLTGVYTVMISSIRYRLPVEPFLIILAGYMLDAGMQWVKNVHKQQKSPIVIDS